MRYRAILTPEQYRLWQLCWGATPEIGLGEVAAPDFVPRVRAAVLDRNEFWVLGDEVRCAIEEYTDVEVPYPWPFKTIGEAYDWMMERMPEEKRLLTLAFPVEYCRTQQIFYRLRKVTHQVALLAVSKPSPHRRLPKMTPIALIRMARLLQKHLDLHWQEISFVSPLIEESIGVGMFPGWRLWMPIFRSPTYADLTHWIANRSRFGLAEMPYNEIEPFDYQWTRRHIV